MRGGLGEMPRSEFYGGKIQVAAGGFYFIDVEFRFGGFVDDQTDNRHLS